MGIDQIIPNSDFLTADYADFADKTKNASNHSVPSAIGG
jgi:hypothetical protein